MQQGGVAPRGFAGAPCDLNVGADFWDADVSRLECSRPARFDWLLSGFLLADSKMVILPSEKHYYIPEFILGKAK